MTTINAFTIHAEILQAAINAPVTCPLADLQETPEYRAAMHCKKLQMEQAITIPLHVKFKTLTGSLTVRNVKWRLEKFAVTIKSKAALFGGGFAKQVPKGKHAIVWQPGKVKLLGELLEDGAYEDALAMGESELGATFYTYDASIYDKGDRVFMTWAPLQVDGLPDFFVSVKDSAGYYKVIHKASGHRVGDYSKSRAKCNASAVEYWDEFTPEKQEKAISGIFQCNHELARAAWCEFHKIGDDRAIQARIAEQDRMDIDRAESRATREALATIEVAQLTSVAQANDSVIEAFAQFTPESPKNLSTPVHSALSTGHLIALMARLDSEQSRLDNSKSSSERAARLLIVADIEKEIEGEHKFLGMPTSADLADVDEAELLADITAPDTTPAVSKMPGIRPMIIRLENARKSFVDCAVEQFGIDEKTAGDAVDYLTSKKIKLVTLDPVDGQFRIKTSEVWHKDVLERAALLWKNAISTEEPTMPPAVSTEATDYTIAPARYSKDKVSVTTPSLDGFKSRAARLAGTFGRWSRRDNGYIMSRGQASTFAKLYAKGWDASIMEEGAKSREAPKPVSEAETTATVSEIQEIVFPPIATEPKIEPAAPDASMAEAEAQPANEPAPANDRGVEGVARSILKPASEAEQATPEQNKLKGKSGNWSAVFFLGVDSHPCMIFTGPKGSSATLIFYTLGSRICALTVLANISDFLPPNNPTTPPAQTSAAPATPLAQIRQFEKVTPARIDLADLIARGVKPEALIGLGAYCRGDMANPSGSGAITAIGHCEWYGLTVDVTLESGYVWRAVRTSEFLDGWFSLDAKMHGAPYLAQLAGTVAALTASKSSAKEQADATHAKALIDLAAQYPKLQRQEGRNTGGKLAAVNIRTLLKQEFKGVKFGVTSDYSSVSVTWNDGPTDNQVRAIIGRFCTGESDAQSDYFYTVKTAFSDLFGGVQYMSTRRTSGLEAIKQALAGLFGEDGPTAEDYTKQAAWGKVSHGTGPHSGNEFRDEWYWTVITRKALNGDTV